jgi:hypothetical protein
MFQTQLPVMQYELADLRGLLDLALGRSREHPTHAPSLVVLVPQALGDWS